MPTKEDLTSKPLTQRVEEGMRLRHAAVEQAVDKLGASRDMAYLSHLDRGELLMEIERLRACSRVETKARLTDAQCDEVIDQLKEIEWSGITRDDVRTWDGMIAEARCSSPLEPTGSLNDRMVRIRALASGGGTLIDRMNAIYALSSPPEKRLHDLGSQSGETEPQLNAPGLAAPTTGTSAVNAGTRPVETSALPEALRDPVKNMERGGNCSTPGGLHRSPMLL